MVSVWYHNKLKRKRMLIHIIKVSLIKIYILGFIIFKYFTCIFSWWKELLTLCRTNKIHYSLPWVEISSWLTHFSVGSHQAVIYFIASVSMFTIFIKFITLFDLSKSNRKIRFIVHWEVFVIIARWLFITVSASVKNYFFFFCFKPYAYKFVGWYLRWVLWVHGFWIENILLFFTNMYLRVTCLTKIWKVSEGISTALFEWLTHFSARTHQALIYFMASVSMFTIFIIIKYITL